MRSETTPKVFISYSHDGEDHERRVLKLAERLLGEGVDVSVDQYFPSPPEGWPRWMDRQIREADFVLLVCTEAYLRRVELREMPGQGKGVLWESNLIFQHVYNTGAQNTKFIAVLLAGGKPDFIPTPIQGATFYFPETEEGYDGLYRQLTGQARIVKPALGTRKVKPPENVGSKAVAAPAAEIDILQGFPSRWASQVDAFLLQYLGTPRNPVPFGGREQDLERLDAWLKDEDAPRYALLEARAGLGKSALLAHWIDRLRKKDSPYALVYFPISARWRTNSEGAVFEALAYRLAALFGEPAPQTQDVRELREVVANYVSRADSRPILIVIDGLDEAAGWQTDTGLFPPRSRSTVRILASARPFGTGPRSWLARLGWNVGGAAKALSLGELDRPGVGEILRQAAPVLAPFADALFEKSEGDPLIVGLYTGKLLELSASGRPFDPRSFAEIEPGLGGFFQYWLDEQVRLWGNERPLREPRARVLMSLCAVAHGPLNQDDIVALAPDVFDGRGAVEAAANDLRRLVMGDGLYQGYVFAHPRLADFVREERLNDRERAEQERRFLDYGKLAIEEFESGGRKTVPEYVVRWYSTHLADSNAESAPFAPLLNVAWCAEWERVDGTPSGFLADLGRIWARSAAAADTGILVRTCLLRSSILTRSRGIGHGLFEQCVQNGVVSTALAEVIARQQIEPAKSSDLLLVLGDFTGQVRLVQDALSAARQIGDPAERARALCAVAVRSPADERAAPLNDALSAARQIKQKYERSVGLTAVAELMAGGDREHALEEALKAAEDVSWNPIPLIRVAELMDAGRRAPVLAQALRRGRGISRDPDKVRALAAVAPQLGTDERDEVLAEALAIARRMDQSLDRAEALSTVAEQVIRRGPGPEFDGALTDLLATGDVQRLISVAEGLSGSEKERTLKQALEVVRDWCRWRGLLFTAGRVSDIVALARQLDAGDREKVLEEAISAARDISLAHDQASALSEVAKELPPARRKELLTDALAAASRIGGEKTQAFALGVLSQRLEGEEGRLVLQRAVSIARQLDRPTHGAVLIGKAESADMLIQVAGETAPARRDLARACFSEFERIKYDVPRAGRLATLARLLDPTDRELFERALEMAAHLPPDVSSEALQPLVERLDRSDRELLHKARSAALRAGDTPGGIACLVAVAARLDDAQTLDKALSCARKIGDLSSHVSALSAIAEALDGADRREVLKEALAAVGQIESEGVRSDALMEVAGRLRPGDGDVARQALVFARQIPYEGDRAVALSVIADGLDSDEREGVLAEALSAAREISYHETLAASGTLSKVSDRLGPEDRHQALAEALDIAPCSEDERDRIDALGSVIAHLREQDRELLIKTLEYTRYIWDEGRRADAIRDLAGHVAPGDTEILERFWKAASDIGNAGIFGVLATKSSGAAMAQYADAMIGAIGQEEAPKMLRALAGRWLEFCHARNSTPAGELAVWLAPLSRMSRPDLTGSLVALIPAIETAGGKPALSTMAQAIADVGRWWP
jgi:hypothetical protein